MYINFGLGQETTETYEQRIARIQEQLKKITEFITAKKPIISPEQKQAIEQATQTITLPPTPTPTAGLDIKSLLPIGLIGGFIYFISQPKKIKKR
jgi:hypothetical protein